ncbi:MAG: radical SAM protein [Candidatus Aureabacteria bacterium]|nr:radical SAM protein [Candidatus Auribacterota bacterium]
MTARNGIRVALVNLPQVVPELMHISRVRKAYSETAQILPNLSLAYLAAQLEREGFEVRYVEAFALKLSVDRIVEALRDFAPHAVCYNLITETFLNSLAYIRTIRERIPAPAIVGGMHLSLYPHETLSHRCIDYGIVGEGWKSLPRLLHSLAEGETDLSGVQGLLYRTGDELVQNAPSEGCTPLESVPFPARHLLPNDAYNCVMSKRFPITVMISSYGCPFKCSYCDVGTLSFQMRSAESVIAEMTECRERHGIREIWFQDETFTLNANRLYAICEALMRSKLDVIWSIRTRADLVTLDMLKAMKRAGCFKIHLGVESADPAVLAELGRTIPLERIRDAFFWAREAGIAPLAFFMIGNPLEDRAALERSISFAGSLPCDFIQVNKLTPCPPSKFYTRVVRETGRDYWAEYTRGNSAAIAEMGNYFSLFPPEELDAWQKKFFRTFYFRPSYIVRRIVEVRSWKEFKSLAKAALSIT